MSDQMSSNQINQEYSIEPELASLPSPVQKMIKDIDFQLRDGEITEKGYAKKRTSILEPYLHTITVTSPLNTAEEMVEPDISTLPDSVIAQLDEVQAELVNEEITQKGYAKKRANILRPYMLKEPPFEDLPLDVQRQYNEIVNELKEGDITEKGFKIRKSKLLRPYLTKMYVQQQPQQQQTQQTQQQPIDGNVFPGTCSSSATDVVTDDFGEGRVIGIQIVENGEKVFKCQVCGEVFKQPQSFSGHCRLHRATRTKNFKCTICNHSYTTRSHLKFHMYKHNGGYPYTCQYCNKGFAGRSQHRYHELRHTGQTPHVCKDCGGRFWKKHSLFIHQTQHCQYRKVAPQDSSSSDGRTTNVIYRCDIIKDCNKMFDSREALTSHISVHGVQTITLTDITVQEGNVPVSSQGDSGAGYHTSETTDGIVIVADGQIHDDSSSFD